VTQRILQSRGHRVWVATQPEEAIKIWAENGSAIDLVICDVVMRELRGPELVARFAEMGPRPRVLLITGYSEEAVRSELGHPVLAKPFTGAGLLRAIRDVLS
jgi:CheY-like chemotaxis protein